MLLGKDADVYFTGEMAHVWTRFLQSLNKLMLMPTA